MENQELALILVVDWDSPDDLDFKLNIALNVLSTLFQKAELNGEVVHIVTEDSKDLITKLFDAWNELHKLWLVPYYEYVEMSQIMV